jgi:hypothetical protein
VTTLLAAFGWAVLHLAWQSAFVWVVWRAYLRWTARAEERYAGGAVALVAISVLFAGSVAFYFGAVTPELLQGPVDALVPAALHYGYPIGGMPVVDSAAVASGAVWLAISCVLLARAVPVWRRGRRLCTRGAAPAHPDVVALVAALTPECGLQRTPGARQSVHIDSPAVFGALRMVLLFPSSSLAHESRIAEPGRRFGRPGTRPRFRRGVEASRSGRRCVVGAAHHRGGQCPGFARD